MAKRTKKKLEDEFPKLDISRWEEQSLQYHRKRVNDLAWFARCQLSHWREDLHSTSAAMREAAQKHVDQWTYIYQSATDAQAKYEEEHARRQNIYRKAKADAAKMIISGG